MEDVGECKNMERRRVLEEWNTRGQGLYIFRNSKIQGFPGMFYHFFQGFSKALEAQNKKNPSQQIV